MKYASIVSISLLLVSFLCLSCKKNMPVEAFKESGDDQFVELNSQAPQPLKVKVVNHLNEAIEGIEVSFGIKNGEGFLEGKVVEKKVKTDANGIAQISWTVGPKNIPQQVEAKIKKLDAPVLVFTAWPQFMTDPRDGEKYLLVKIGDRIWTAQNMRYNMPGSMVNLANPSTVYGRLYSWFQAQTVCPEGWHLPDRGEWYLLAAEVGNQFESIGRKLKSRNGWLNEGNGKDLVGFNIYPAGHFTVNLNEFRGLGETAIFWTRDEVNSNDSWYHILTYNSSQILEHYYEKNTPSSCRCVKNL